jgi:hypothetical protein
MWRVSPVLIGCEESQIVCKAFRDAGYEAYSCDLQPTRGNPVEGREQRIWKMPPSATRKRDRSETFPGIAKAMVLQWG